MLTGDRRGYRRPHKQKKRRRRRRGRKRRKKVRYLYSIAWASN
jgi:hypothetical protein